MISRRWKWVQELQDDNEVQVVKVASRYNLSDILTKCLDNVEFNRQVAQIQKLRN